jgi:hypothetical protein
MSRILFPCIVFVLLLAGCKKKDAEIQQPPPPPYTPIVLISSSFTLGNKEKGILDTFYLQFNKPVQVTQLELVSDFCLPELKVTIDSNTVKFYNLLCAMLGKDYKFRFTVKDKEGKAYVDSVKFSYYTRKLPVEGTRSHFMIAEDNKFCWVTAREPIEIPITTS